MKIVLDTNVLISGLINPYGSPGQMVRMISSGLLQLCFDSRLIEEYSEVMKRPKFPFRKEEVEVLLEQIQSKGRVVASQPLRHRLKDTKDEPFLEVAVAAKVEWLITGNWKHFPSRYLHVKIGSPAEFLEFYRKQ